MLSPYEQEIARLNRFRAALHGGTQPASVDSFDQRIDAVCATIRENRGNSQTGISLLNVRPSARDEVNHNKARLAQQIDELLQTLTPPADLVGDLLDLYLPGYSQEGIPVNAQTRRALTASAHAMHPSVLGPINPLVLWNVPQDSPVRPQLKAWLELHAALKAVDDSYDTLTAAHTDLLTEPSSEQVLDDDLDWGPFLSQALLLTDLNSGEVQELNLTHVALTGSDWVLTAAQLFPSVLADSVLRLTTENGSFTGDLPHQAMIVQGHELHVLSVPNNLHDLLGGLTVADVAQVTVLQTPPPMNPARPLN